MNHTVYDSVWVKREYRKSGWWKRECSGGAERISHGAVGNGIVEECT